MVRGGYISQPERVREHIGAAKQVIQTSSSGNTMRGMDRKSKRRYKDSGCGSGEVLPTVVDMLSEYDRSKRLVNEEEMVGGGDKQQQ